MDDLLLNRREATIFFLGLNRREAATFFWWLNRREAAKFFCSVFWVHKKEGNMRLIFGRDDKKEIFRQKKL